MARVLIIEDEPSIALVLTQALSYMGHEVMRAPDGRAGLQHLAQGPLPDLILLDLFMPAMGGKAFLAQMRSQPAWKEIPVILLTGAVPTREDFPPEGQYQSWMPKPFAVADLMETVNRLLTLQCG